MQLNTFNHPGRPSGATGESNDQATQTDQGNFGHTRWGASGIALFAQASCDSEPDLLVGNRLARLRLKSLAGDVLAELLPQPEWTHEALFAVTDDARTCEMVKESGGADLYLGDVCIGSTEV